MDSLDPVALANAKIAFAALCGGITRLLFKPASSILKAAWLLFGCVTCGFYGTPAVVIWWHFPQDYAGAVGALLGFIGLSFAEAMLRWADKFDLAGWILRMLEKRGGA